MSESAPAPLIDVESVSKAFDSAGRMDGPRVLDDISLSVLAGESVAIIGPSGSGKSTLLNIIGALLPPTSGTVRVDGCDLATMDEAAAARFRNERIGFVFQMHHLLPHCTALENVLVPTIVHPDGNIRSSAPERARALLERVGLGERMSHRPGQLSGGECQRVAVARALINQPRLILADEPTGSLDEDGAERLGDLLVDLNESDGVTIVTVTHSLHLAGRLQRGFRLRRGRLEPWIAE